ncbi:uncharacterized protein LOC119986980 [Tripterygium wilfordii]|uniref:uncharacterized protein LOC119986980 n=1 Tax=Tripterygium wilfordii TaxID=458696 RepID=UPI0018F81E99|nr:uncharacterized protein LOC119986980 [Tripterygium wilfordii]
MNQSYSFTIFFFFIFVLACADEDQDFIDCHINFNCGELADIGYPFWGNGRPEKCGHPLFMLECFQDTTTNMLVHQRVYQVVHIDPFSHTINISRPRERCPPTFENETFAYPFNYSATVQKLILFYNCTAIPDSSLSSNNFSCPVLGTERDAFYGDDILFGGARFNDTACNIQVKVPVEEDILSELIQTGVGLLDEALNEPFGVNYQTHILCDACEGSGGNCGTNLSSLTREPQFICYCHDGHHQPVTCADDKDRSGWKRKLTLGIGASFGSVAIICTMILICRIVKGKILSNKDDQELEAIINGCGLLPVKRYCFSDIKKITCSLKDKLGQGGYGSVYKGKLFDGRLVAVKVLNTTKGDGQDFMNEVLSISKTSHVNIVTLLGFCLEGSKRALIYEFMSNGSLEKFIYGKSNTNTNHHFLGWENMFRIAVEIAQGLEYLHRGCNTRILHFDIKPHNILLDEDFCPKISDFGLAKLCIKKESIVSILEARGTIGYIAPELFSRNLGGVSHKSDVYSYGMMILEMVGAINNTNIKGENSSEAYFPHWIYKRLEEENDFELNGDVMTDMENEAARKMVLVGLWCIQTHPSQRPNISEVLDMLKGSVENLQVPPRPFVTSPSRSPLFESLSSSVLILSRKLEINYALPDEPLTLSRLTISVLFLSVSPQPMNQSYSFTIFFFFIIFVLAWADEDKDFLDCNIRFNCGKLVNISYPFWGNDRPEKCGDHQFGLKCVDNITGTISFNLHEYQVEDINSSSHTIKISTPREICTPPFVDETLASPFSYSSTVQNLTLFYNCTSNPFFIESPRYYFLCPVNGTERDVYYARWVYGEEEFNDTACTRKVDVPVEEEVLVEFLDNGVVNHSEALKKPFRVNYFISTYALCDNCVASGGNCGTNLNSSTQFICYCQDGHHQPFTCADDKDRWGWKRKLTLGIGATFGSVAIICTMILICRIVKGKILSNKDDQELEAIINDCGLLPVKRYSFSDIKKITCSLKDKLGQGGYGSVYKGKLFDGRLVAVKVLNTTKGDGQDFMNEVLSISKTSHVNIVTLLGFCLEGSKRALIYEFMSNGSLEKFIYGKSNTNTNHHFLGWENMFRIAVEIAQGLEYLHRGCNTRILHFDIKPHNILLDEDFCPKISDFGLAKLCIKKESTVSILEARGTIGYIAPELFSRNLGGVSHKSDVYSYGMMILEMVGAINNTNIKGENSSETYFPHWIYKRLDEENDFGLNGDVMTDMENEAERKMVMVGLWCIQTDPSQRPNISEVLDMLKGSVENLQVPPRPFVASPSRSSLFESLSSSIL